jgi:hypothetical protein
MVPGPTCPVCTIFLTKCRLSLRSGLAEISTSCFVDFAKPQVWEATTSPTFAPNYSAVPLSPARVLAAASFGPDALQQSLAHGRSVPAYLCLSFRIRIRKEGHSLRGQYSVLAKDLSAFFTMLQVSLQFGQL